MLVIAHCMLPGGPALGSSLCLRRRTFHKYEGLTKLRVVGLDEFSKVMMLKSEMLIASADRDEIFAHPVPAAAQRQSSSRDVVFAKVQGETSLERQASGRHKR